MPHSGRVGVLLLQLGTPDAPTEEAVRRYLREFLSDRRVIDRSRLVWWPILHLSVLRTRPAQSARLYQRIWTTEGSPLAVITGRQAAALEASLSAAYGQRVPVVVGMRYGRPSIATALERLTAAGIDRVLALSMYPQYASATIGSSLERLFEELQARRTVPAVRIVPPYFDDTLYLDAIAVSARESLDGLGWTPDHIIVTFHGLPRRYADSGDPYVRHCEKTMALLTSRLGWTSDAVTMTYQSRFGREEWLRPYTDETLADLARRGARVAALCPGFTADCLETLEEIGITGREHFMAAGGAAFHLIPCLNDHRVWIASMTALATRELQGWLSVPD